MRVTKNLFALLMSLCMVVGSLTLAFAAKPVNVVHAKDVKAFLEAGEAMCQNSSLFQLQDGKTADTSDPYQTGRLLVRPGKALDQNVLKDAKEAVDFKGWYLLQYNTEQATKAAYEAARQAYGEANVLLDQVFQVDLPKAVSVQATNQDQLSWGISNMGLDKVKKQLKARGNKTNITVAILDTGISFFEQSFLNRIVNPFDMVAFTPLPHDFHGHGTHCASTILQATPNNVKVMPVKTVTGLGFGTVFNTLFGLMYVQMMGADVVNMSLAAEDPYQLKVYDGVLKTLFENRVVIVAAAGNEKHNVKNSYPANSEYVITVGATKPNNRVDRSYSNYGTQIDFAAPGTDVTGISTEFGLPAVARMTGTSMAAPHVSAAAALIKCVHPNYNMKQVYAVLKRYSIDIEAKGKDPYAGWGRIDLSNFAKTF